jgi:hypothetical protein
MGFGAGMHLIYQISAKPDKGRGYNDFWFGYGLTPSLLLA